MLWKRQNHGYKPKNSAEFQNEIWNKNMHDKAAIFSLKWRKSRENEIIEVLCAQKCRVIHSMKGFFEINELTSH